MKIYFVRHGQTNLNKDRLIQGRLDEPLNKTGIKQAKETGQLLKSLNIDFKRIVSSPLSRALETAHYSAKKLNYKEEIIILPKYIERDFGNWEYKTINDSFDIIMADGFQEEGFEDNEQLIPRIKLGTDELYQDFKDETVIAFVHAHVIRSVYILADPNKYTYTNFFLGNASIHVFEYDGNNFKLLETHNNEE